MITSPPPSFSFSSTDKISFVVCIFSELSFNNVALILPLVTAEDELILINKTLKTNYINKIFLNFINYQCLQIKS